MPQNGLFVRRQAEAVAQFTDIATLHAVEKTAEILSPDELKSQNTEGSNWGLSTKNLALQKENAFEISINEATHFEVIVYYPKSGNRFLKFIRQFSAYHKGFNAVKKQWGVPDLVHLHVIVSAGIYALFLHCIHRIPFLITEHSSIYRIENGVFERGNWIFKTLIRRCVKKAKAVVALSPFYASTMRQHGLESRFFYVPNVVDTDLFKPLFTSCSSGNASADAEKFTDNQSARTINLIHVSGLHDPIKNVSGILNAIKKLSEKRQDFILDIIGDPFEQPPYLALVEQLNIEKFVRFYPYLPIERVAEKMQNADIFVLFSRFEGLPCVILEAMSAGLPVVATETGGISDWITEGSGRLIESEDETALVKNLDFIMTHLDTFNPELIRQKTVETCSYRAVGQAVADVYKQIK
jgi:glycosyltransferase involved in cell wall biosynthesis